MQNSHYNKKDKYSCYSICISDRYSASCVAIFTAIQAFESTININHGILIANSCRQFTNNVQVGSNNQVKHVRTKL